MKAQDRHKLKQNELADYLEDIKEYFDKHGKLIMTIAVVVLFVLAAGVWVFRSVAASRMARLASLQQAIILAAQQEQEAVNAARDVGNDAVLTDPYNPAEMINTLASIAEKDAGSGVGMAAMLQQALLLQGKILFSNSDMTQLEEAELLKQIEEIYQRALQQYPDKTTARGLANLGLALIAENRRQWDEAKKIYRQVEADKTLQFTVFPMQARKRLEVMDKYTEDIVFPETSAVEAAPANVTGKAPAEINETAPASAKPGNNQPSSGKITPKTAPENKAAPVGKKTSEGANTSAGQNPAPPKPAKSASGEKKNPR